MTMCSTSLIVPVRLFAGIASAFSMFALSVVRAVAPINCRNFRLSVLNMKCLLLSRFVGSGNRRREPDLGGARTASYEASETLSQSDDVMMNLKMKLGLNCVTDSKDTRHYNRIPWQAHPRPL